MANMFNKLLVLALALMVSGGLNAVVAGSESLSFSDLQLRANVVGLLGDAP